MHCMKKHTAMTPLLPNRSAAMGTPNLVRVLSTDMTTKTPAADPLDSPRSSAIATRNNIRMAWPAHPQKWIPIRFQNALVCLA